VRKNKAYLLLLLSRDLKAPPYLDPDDQDAHENRDSKKNDLSPKSEKKPKLQKHERVGGGWKKLQTQIQKRARAKARLLRGCLVQGNIQGNCDILSNRLLKCYHKRKICRSCHVAIHFGIFGETKMVNRWESYLKFRTEVAIMQA
jgi:hypothetical protein